MRVDNEADPASIRILDDLLYDYNRQVTGHDDGAYLSILLRDPAGAVVGGLHGWSWGGVGYVLTLVVPAAMRRQGHGSALMDAFEAEARRRGCFQLVLQTHDFQAPDFYRARGFAVVGEVVNFPRGFRHLTLVKQLDQSAMGPG
jgi:ribosomal protein S18 acetylase RimI-like enzyme